MQARITNLPALVPDAVKRLVAFSGTAQNAGVPETTANLIPALLRPGPAVQVSSSPTSRSTGDGW
jgi:hypothetical protein